MTWLVTGAGGQLGSDLRRILPDAVGLGHGELDLTDADSVAAAVARVRPEVVVNAAAYTAVDNAESDVDTAFAVNATGPANLAAACAKIGARLIQVSTDYVFPGDADTPYDVDAPTGPRSVYGRSKLAGEQEVVHTLPDLGYVVRTAWVYGAAGSNFVKTMVRLESSKDAIDVVDDQRGSPTWSADLARGLVSLGQSNVPGGIYHCTNSSDTTWCGLARAVFEELGADPKRVRPTTTDTYVRPAPRPAYSVLSDAAWLAAGLPAMPQWRDALAAAFRTYPREFGKA